LGGQRQFIKNNALEIAMGGDMDVYGDERRKVNGRKFAF
jgi:hypothetical protein